MKILVLAAALLAAIPVHAQDEDKPKQAYPILQSMPETLIGHWCLASAPGAGIEIYLRHDRCDDERFALDIRETRLDSLILGGCKLTRIQKDDGSRYLIEGVCQGAYGENPDQQFQLRQALQLDDCGKLLAISPDVEIAAYECTGQTAEPPQKWPTWLPLKNDSDAERPLPQPQVEITTIPTKPLPQP
jgi:hypothetical protein